MATCSAIVGKDDIEIKANYIANTRLVYSANKSFWILDNIKLNRNRTAL